MPRKKTLDAVGYNGNQDLPLPNEVISLTEEEMTEYVRCSHDPIYFISNYVKIVHVDHGIVKFDLWEFQKEIIRTFQSNRFVICKLARQSGKSSVVVCGYFLWYILFHADVSLGILANKEATAIMLLDRLKESYALLPRFLKQGIVKWDQKLIKLGNNTRVRAEATSASAVRGDTFNILFLDEFAFVPENVALDFMTSVFPTISSGNTTKLFIVSTPAGYNLFYKIFNDAMEGRNSYKPIAYTWRDVPGRDKVNAQGENIWEKEIRQNMSNDQKWAQEFECDFLGSANTLIASWKLAQLSYVEPKEERGKFKMYHKPVHQKDDAPGHVYVVTVDVGQGQQEDFSVIVVTDITESPFRQAGVFRDNDTKPAQLAPQIRDIARYYNSAHVLIEINGEGLAVADMLMTELEYENVIAIYPHPKKGQKLSSGFHPRARPGIKMSEATKRIGCTGLKSLIENDKLIISDWQTMRELTTFVGKKSARGANIKTYEAEVGQHDDTVLPLVLLGWLTLQSEFENYVGLSMRQLLMEGGAPPSLDEPFIGILGDLSQTVVIEKSPLGYDVIDDPSFWRDDVSSGNWL